MLLFPSVLNQKFLSTLGLDGDRAVTKPFAASQDVVGGFGPAKGPGVGIADVDLGSETGLQYRSRAAPRLICWSVSNAKKRSAWLSDDEDIGVKVHIPARRRVANQSRISLFLWLDAPSMTM